MAFGMIADTPDAGAPYPQANTPPLRLSSAGYGARSKWVRGCSGIRRIFYEYFVTTHVELKTYRDRLYRGGREPSREEKIGLGRLFDSVLKATREEAAEKVTMQMNSRCAELALDKPRNEREAVNIACLIDRDRQKEFEQGSSKPRPSLTTMMRSISTDHGRHTTSSTLRSCIDWKRSCF